MRYLVTGAGGFIGAHLAITLKRQGDWVRAVDRVYNCRVAGVVDEYHVKTLTSPHHAKAVCRDIDRVYDLAAEMGGMGYIASNDAIIVATNTLINTHVLLASREAGVARYLFTSSACVSPEGLQTETTNPGLAETDAWPADPDTGYGLQKLVHERLCLYAAGAGWLPTRIARLHNVYGPEGTWRGGREKAPAALCRKVAEAKLDRRDHIEVWGDGQQTRSFLYVDDCVDALQRLMASEVAHPINVGSDRLVSIDDLARLVMDAAGYPCTIQHVPGPQGVRGRCSDNALCQAVLDWAPTTSLEVGLSRTYRWVERQVVAARERERRGAA